ncbi:hypothetical protein, partial [Adlercreutzia murintestinalis]|uniref:hypothetical protein n=1 Tax=Adlercreutzia murintestinalis TaxID=2941325 RepID=UPI00203C3C69
ASVQDVDATTLADCTGVEIYVPYNADETYAWRAGVPATGNHLIPYGVSMPDAPLVLNQDETAELLGDTGYLKSEGRIDVRYAYDAAPISVDPSTGTVTAKQTGKTTVTAQLRLNDKLLASASRAVIVALAPKPEEPAEDDATDEKDEEAAEDDHDHEGEEGCTEGVDAPDVSYRDQLFEEGDYYTNGAHDYEEKVINRSVVLASMDAEISTMSLEVPEVASWSGNGDSSGNFTGASGSRGWNFSYDSATRTLTVTMKSTATWCKISECGGKINCTGGGGTHNYNFRKSQNKLNAVRKLVLINFDHKNPKMFFSKMTNLEEVEIQGNFLSNTYNGNKTGITSVESMFSDCPQLRIIPSNMTLPSTVTNTTELFAIGDHKGDGSRTNYILLKEGNQFTSSATRLPTTYAGNDSKIITALDSFISSPIHTDENTSGRRERVTSYRTVTFDNRGGSGGHQTAGESSSATTKTYTIKVP